MYEQVFRHILFPLYEGPITGRHTHRFLAEYEYSQWLAPTQLEELRRGKLNALLEFCWVNVPFLREYWTDHGTKRSPLGHTSELASYPTIDKQLISSNFERMRATRGVGRVLSKSTGGSTGDPFRFEYTEESYARRTATMWRGYRWCGTDLGRRTAYLWGTGAPLPGLRGLKERLYHRAFNRRIFDAFRMTEDNLPEYVEELNRFQPRIIVAYVAPLALLARHAIKNQSVLFQPKAIITGAESLARTDRETIEKAFDAPVFNTYGCREFMLIASECERRDGLHVCSDHLVVETVDESGQPVQGESGNVAVTDLHNYAMPFVRYLNGDRATLSGQRCECGRGLPLMDSVDGRILDVITTPDGRVVPGEFFVHAMLDFTDVKQYQVVQNTRTSLEVRIVPRAGFTADDRQRLRARIGAFVGPEVELSIVDVDTIPLTASGKRRVTVSLVQ